MLKTRRSTRKLEMSSALMLRRVYQQNRDPCRIPLVRRKPVSVVGFESHGIKFSQFIQTSSVEVFKGT